MPQLGEWVSVKAFGIIDHFGIATGDGWVISNSMRHQGVIVQSEQEFAEGKQITRHGVPDPAYAQTAVSRAMSRVKQPWKALTDNCEHFVRWAYGQKPESPQLTSIAILLVVSAGTALFLKTAKW